jgi:hypothetical protein
MLRMVIKIGLLLGIMGAMAFCSSPTESKSRHITEFQWSTDTLKDLEGVRFPVTLESMWGSSAGNVYAAGWSGTWVHSLWHYDGEEWKVCKHLEYYGGTIEQGFDAEVVYGFEEDDVWVGGRDYQNSNIRLIHYNGTIWKEFPVEPVIRNGAFFRGIWGASPDDVWFWGRCDTSKIFILHWDGNTLKRDTIRATPTSVEHYTSFGGNASGELYCAPLQYVYGEGRTQYLLKYESGNWNLLGTHHKYLIKKIWLSPEGDLFGGGEGFLRWDGKDWIQYGNVYEMVATDYCGLSSSDIMVVGGTGGLYWFDGNVLNGPLANLEKLGYNDLKGGWYNGEEAFVVGWPVNYLGVTVIFHGK